jgi:hypothetical protein
MPFQYLTNTDETNNDVDTVNLPDVADGSGNGRLLSIFALCQGGGGAGSQDGGGNEGAPGGGAGGFSGNLLPINSSSRNVVYQIGKRGSGGESDDNNGGDSIVQTQFGDCFAEGGEGTSGTESGTSGGSGNISNGGDGESGGAFEGGRDGGGGDADGFPSGTTGDKGSNEENGDGIVLSVDTNANTIRTVSTPGQDGGNGADFGAGSRGRDGGSENQGGGGFIFYGWSDVRSRKINPFTSGGSLSAAQNRDNQYVLKSSEPVTLIQQKVTDANPPSNVQNLGTFSYNNSNDASVTNTEIISDTTNFPQEISNFQTRTTSEVAIDFNVLGDPRILNFVATPDYINSEQAVPVPDYNTNISFEYRNATFIGIRRYFCDPGGTGCALQPVNPYQVTITGSGAGNVLLANSHRLYTGDRVQLTGTVTGLSNGGIYFVLRVDNNSFSLAATLNNLQNYDNSNEFDPIPDPQIIGVSGGSGAIFTRIDDPNDQFFWRTFSNESSGFEGADSTGGMFNPGQTLTQNVNVEFTGSPDGYRQDAPLQQSVASGLVTPGSFTRYELVVRDGFNEITSAINVIAYNDETPDAGFGFLDQVDVEPPTVKGNPAGSPVIINSTYFQSDASRNIPGIDMPVWVENLGKSIVDPQTGVATFVPGSAATNIFQDGNGGLVNALRIYPGVTPPGITYSFGQRTSNLVIQILPEEFNYVLADGSGILGLGQQNIAEWRIRIGTNPGIEYTFRVITRKPELKEIFDFGDLAGQVPFPAATSPDGNWTGNPNDPTEIDEQYITIGNIIEVGDDGGGEDIEVINPVDAPSGTGVDPNFGQPYTTGPQVRTRDSYRQDRFDPRASGSGVSNPPPNTSPTGGVWVDQRSSNINNAEVNRTIKNEPVNPTNWETPNTYEGDFFET